MKVVRLADAFEYPVTGHFDMRALRLHNKETSNTVDYTLGLSHFLPGGGANVAPANFEMIYYIISGEMTVELYDDNDNCEKVVLHAGDSVHFGKGTKRGCLNTGIVSAQMMTIMIKPQG